MSKHEVEYKGEKYEFSEEQYEELKSAIELIEKLATQSSLILI